MTSTTLVFLRKIERFFPFFKAKAGTAEENQKLGTLIGVFIPNLLMLYGVIIFLRLGWVVGQAGLASSMIAMGFAFLIALLTSLSLASIATNTQVGKGGVYYILSRSLGIEVGCAIGIPLFIKQTLAISFCVVGFAESLHDLIPSWSISTIGIYTLLILTGCAAKSLNAALKIQVVILVAIIASFISLFTGGEVAPVHPETFVPAPLKSLGFWTIFAIFFPAMTGSESSVSLSGNLRNPSRSLSLGVIASLCVAFLTYVVIAIFLVNHVPMERLANDPMIMPDVASVPSLIIVGIWGATLSSALGGMLTAPRTLQAISDDGVIPRLFGKTYGSTNEPRIAILTTFIISFLGVYYGSINVIAPMMTMICLICYGVLNLSAGLEGLMDNPSWRPRFRVRWPISILAAFLCLLTMLMINAAVAMLALCFVLIIYLIARKQQFHSPWEDIRQGLLSFLSRFTIHQLAAEGHARSWRPHFLVFNKNTKGYSNRLLAFTQAVSRNKGFLTISSFFPKGNEEERKELRKHMLDQLHKQKVQAFVKVEYSENVIPSMNQMMKNYGLGPLRPNTLVFGGIPKEEGTFEFARMIQSAYRRNYNILIINDETASLPNNTASHKTLLKDLHIWWDTEQQTTSEFMLVLAYMLQRNATWKKERIRLKGIVADELLRQEKLKEFEELAHRKRLHLDVEMLVSANQTSDMIDYVKTFSKEASLIFLGLRRANPEESIESYAEYLQFMARLSDELPSLVLVLSSEHNPFETILK